MLPPPAKQNHIQTIEHGAIKKTLPNEDRYSAGNLILEVIISKHLKVGSDCWAAQFVKPSWPVERQGGRMAGNKRIECITATDK